MACTFDWATPLVRRGWYSSTESSSSLVTTEEGALSNAEVNWYWDLRKRKLKAPTRWMMPEVKAKKNKKWVTFNPVDGLVNQLDARRERNRGDRPKSAKLAPEAAPRCWGKAREAAKSDEKYLFGYRV
jgi:hypothetical protein